MFNSGNGYSLADLATAVKGEEGGFAQGGAWWIIILFLFIFMGNGQFGGNGIRQAASTEDVQNQFNFASLERQNNEIIATTRQAHYDTVSATKDLAYNNLSAIKDLSMDNVISSNAIQAELSRMGYAQQACC